MNISNQSDIFKVENSIAEVELSIGCYSNALVDPYSNYFLVLPALSGFSATSFAFFKIQGRIEKTISYEVNSL